MPEWIPVVSAWFEHAPFAFWITEVHHPRCLVELGAHWGFSYMAFCQSVQRNQTGTACHAVDTWKGDESAGIYGEEVFTEVSDYNRKHYAAFSTLIRSTFDDAVDRFPDGTIDLLHIDGFHTYEAVKHDFETWLPKLSDRGIVLFHDTDVRERGFGVWKLWQELSGKYPHFEFLHGHGLGVLGVGNDLPPELQGLFAISNDTRQTADLRNIYARLGTGVAEHARFASDTNTLKAGISQLEETLGRHVVELERSRADHSLEVAALQSENRRLEEEKRVKQKKIDQCNAVYEGLRKRQGKEVQQLTAKFLDKQTETVSLGEENRRLLEMVRSAEDWQRSWFRRAFRRWHLPGGGHKRHSFFRRLEMSFRKRRDWVLANVLHFSSKVEPSRHVDAPGLPMGASHSTGATKRFFEENALAVYRHYRPNLAGLDPNKKTVLLVTHEISRTGAPILVLNMAGILKRKYNVLVLMLGGGALVEEFTDACDVLMGPFTDEQRQAAYFTLLFRHFVDHVPIAFAVVNTIVANVVVKPLWENEIPSIHLIHEFASYTRPRGTFLESAVYSSTQIFSASVVRDNAVLECPEIGMGNVLVLPQGLCKAPGIANNPVRALEEQQLIRDTFRPAGWPGETVVILGLGVVQIRKGVDLFIACAKRVVEKNPAAPFRFVWIGHNYNPENDLTYSVYIEDQIARSGLKDHMVMMNEVSELETAYKESDVLFLSSRLDPLPLVSQEALSHGKPVVCFEGASGIAEYLSGHPDAALGVVPYLDVEAAANRICDLIDDGALRKRTGDAGRQIAESRFSLEKYVARIEEIGLEHAARKEAELVDRNLIIKSGLFRPDFYGSPAEDFEPDDPLRQYMSEWAGATVRRKPFPGFHPGIYADGNDVGHRDPLAHYIEAGQPVGPWRYDVIEVNEEKIPEHKLPRVGLHIHLYYEDMARSILDRLKGVETPMDLLISVASVEAARKVEAGTSGFAPGKVDIRIVPNRGRDIGPFLTEFNDSIACNYDIIGHLHSKKSINLANADFIQHWVEFLYENLLGGKMKMADAILRRMASDTTIGFVFPDDPFVVDWEENWNVAVGLAKRLGIERSLPRNSINFPVGTMFWARTDALKPLFDLGFGWDDYPPEPVPYDGSLLHAIERILPFISETSGFRTLVTNVRGITR